jgi:threonine dehydrogenase-like Zn-dependent dehydrogenase
MACLDVGSTARERERQRATERKKENKRATEQEKERQTWLTQGPIPSALLGICGSDVHFWKDGKIGSSVICASQGLGHESAGEIIQVGENVQDLKIGELGFFVIFSKKKYHLVPCDVCIPYTPTRVPSSSLTSNLCR